LRRIAGESSEFQTELEPPDHQPEQRAGRAKGVGPDYSDAQLGEIFLHHRVLIIPVVEDRQVVAIVTRTDFFRALATRFLER
jgi:CBS-domain-containing membrane protein